MSIDETINSFEKNISTADQRLDTQNEVDEKKVVNKVKRVSSLFSSFENRNLEKFRRSLPKQKFKELEEEFQILKKSFEEDINRVNRLLENIDTLKFSVYRKIVESITDRFYGLTEVSDKDETKNTIWAMLVIYAGLDKDPNKQKYIHNWKKIVNWVQEYENIDPRKIHKGDIILFPQSITLFKNLNQYKDLIDLEELFLHNKLKFKKELKKEEK